MQNDEYVDMVAVIGWDVLDRLGDNAEARFQFFKRFVELAKSVSDAHRVETPQVSALRNQMSADLRTRGRRRRH